MGWDGVPNGSFNFPPTLWVYRQDIYPVIYIYIIKICHLHSYGFQNLMSSWELEFYFQNYQRGEPNFSRERNNPPSRSDRDQSHPRGEANLILYNAIE